MSSRVGGASRDVRFAWDSSRRDQLERLFRAHARGLSDYVAHHYPRADVDDIVSATFEIAGNKLEVIEPGKERAWLLAVARNLMQNGRRGSRRRNSFDEALRALQPRLTVELSDEQVLAEDIEPFRRAFARLNVRDQEILLLVVWEDLSTAEVAYVLGITVKQASDHLHRARLRLRDRVNKERRDG